MLKQKLIGSNQLTNGMNVEHKKNKHFFFITVCINRIDMLFSPTNIMFNYHTPLLGQTGAI